MTGASEHILAVPFPYLRNGQFVIIELLWNNSSEQLSLIRSRAVVLLTIVRGSMNEVTRIINAIEQADPQYVVLL